MPKKLDKKDLEMFIKQVKLSNEVDFPRVAKTMGYDWFVDIKPRLEDEWFREQMEAVLEEVKFRLLQGVYKVACDGKSKGRGELTYVNAIIKLMDSGAFFGKSNVEEEDPEDIPLSEREISRHLERLGITKAQS